MTSGTLLSVNVGLPRSIEWHGRVITTAIHKEPVAGAVMARGVNIEGDAQADLTVHGGADKAVYAYAVEDLGWWSRELSRPVLPGTFGENLTVEGIDVTSAVIGQRWRIGDLELEVAQPRLPCFKLGLRMDDAGFVRRFARAGRPGVYLRIIAPGELRSGDRVAVARAPAHGVTVAEVGSALLGGEGSAAALRAPQLPDRVRLRLLERVHR
jgi:MOSC domain-containing protein YiiM